MSLRGSSLICLQRRAGPTASIVIPQEQLGADCFCSTVGRLPPMYCPPVSDDSAGTVVPLWQMMKKKKKKGQKLFLCEYLAPQTVISESTQSVVALLLYLHRHRGHDFIFIIQWEKMTACMHIWVCCYRKEL